ncbi:uncharacterized protein CDAR_566971 [Caerostris darwini]|uniref:Uncharacterized protein n=1 Tax=Caerostris darwini TaxID=1538125 RepID=A0AAV4MD98_9ARAC|nr:uncharacterized protein CDAR_566971 [Caerostris darwini]
MLFERVPHLTEKEDPAKAETHTDSAIKYPAWLPMGFLRLGQNFRTQSSDPSVLLDTVKTILRFHSGDESESETTYIFNREVPASYLDTHEMSEAECDRDLHDFCEKNEKFQIFEQYDGQRICIT